MRPPAGGAWLRARRVRRYDFNGSLKHRFTAHPKVDPVTAELVFFGNSDSTVPAGPERLTAAAAAPRAGV
jgi:hypothetical protein